MGDAVYRASGEFLADAADRRAVGESVVAAGAGYVAHRYPLAILFVQVRHAGSGALIAKRPEPVGMSGAGGRAGFAAGDYPIDASSVWWVALDRRAATRVGAFVPSMPPERVK